MMKQASKRPITKVRAGGIAGLITAIVAIVAWWLNVEYGLFVAPSVQAAASIVVVFVVQTVVSYYTKPSPLDTPVPITEQEPVLVDTLDT